MADYISVKVQRLIRTISNGCCEYCQAPAEYSAAFYHFDHILPAVKGGKSTFSNIAYSCAGCNGYKSDKTHFLDPLTHQITKLYHPKKDKWDEHFQWNNDYLSIEGISPIGRTTVALLQLNREGLRNLRQILILVGAHPQLILNLKEKINQNKPFPIG
jgi:hypothetical protein